MQSLWNVDIHKSIINNIRDFFIWSVFGHQPMNDVTKQDELLCKTETLLSKDFS